MLADANKKQHQILSVRIITLNTNYTRDTNTVSKVQNAPRPPFLLFFSRKNIACFVVFFGKRMLYKYDGKKVT